MARNMQPIAKRCKALNLSPAAMGYDKKTTNRNPKGQMRRKQSEYAMQLTEKQKVKFVYGIMEKQFHMYYEKANRMQGKTGENLLTLIERRLDNVVYRLGFAKTRREARQLTTHGHFTVNGQRVDIPSYLVKVGDVIEVREKSRASVKFKGLVGEDAPMVTIPKWLERAKNTLQGKVVAIHGISIGAHSKMYRQRLYDLLKKADVMMVCCPTAWIDTARTEMIGPMHNSMTPVDELVPAGVTVALGTDNVCDAMVPWSAGDMWHELQLLATGCRFDDFEQLVNIATVNGRKVLGLE